MAAKKNGGKRKAPEGLTEVLYVRCTPEMLTGLDVLSANMRLDHPGMSVSRADAVRVVLATAIEDAIENAERRK